MKPDTQTLLAKRTKSMSGSAIREILKILVNPKITSLAGGLPSPESFPMDIINQLHKIVMEKYGTTAFQYGITEGFIPLREALSKYLKTKGINAPIDEIYISSGSQGALDGVGKVFINEGDLVAVESPTYLGALSAFNPYQPKYIEIQTDDEGVIPASLDEILTKHKVKLVYLIPTFQNPTGKTLGLERRKKVAEILKKHGAMAIEDDPYGELRFRGKALPSIKSFAPDNVIYMSTFSKIFAPGLRLGFTVAPKEVGQWMTYAKQGADLHSNSYGQALAAEYVAGGYLERHLPKIIEIYRPKQEAMLKAIEQYFPSDFKWTKPEAECLFG